MFELIVLDLKVVDFFAFLLYDCLGGWEGDGGVVHRFQFINNCAGDERFCCGVQGSSLDNLAFLNVFLTVCIVCSTMSLLCGYSGLLRSWSKLQDFANLSYSSELNCGPSSLITVSGIP